jgi:hypothetical protein
MKSFAALRACDCIGGQRVARAAREQVELVPRSLEETVAQDHPARAIWALLERLDLGGSTGRSVPSSAGRSRRAAIGGSHLRHRAIRAVPADPLRGSAARACLRRSALADPDGAMPSMLGGRLVGVAILDHPLF